jgi:Na+/proline symporter
MIQNSQPKPSRLNGAMLTLIAILLAFLAVLVFIWLWYDLKNSSLEKQKPATVQTTR